MVIIKYNKNHASNRDSPRPGPKRDPKAKPPFTYELCRTSKIDPIEENNSVKLTAVVDLNTLPWEHN